jgi:acetate CoA/acetoacetate CoA-transferase alpha subunit
MIMAGRCSLVEVEEIVPAGELDPEVVVVPGIFVDGLVVRAGD